MKKNFVYSEIYPTKEEFFFDDKTLINWIDKPNLRGCIELDLGSDNKSKFKMYINRKTLKDISVENFERDIKYEITGKLVFVFDDGEIEKLTLYKPILKANYEIFRKLNKEFADALILLLEIGLS